MNWMLLLLAYVLAASALKFIWDTISQISGGLLPPIPLIIWLLAIFAAKSIMSVQISNIWNEE